MRCHACNAELPATAEWCNQCLAPVKREGQHEPVDRSEPEPWVTVPPEYSAVRKGPYSFGLGGKLIITGIIVALGLGLYVLAIWLTDHLKTPGMALVLLFLIPYTILALIFLWGTWRPTRVK